MTLYQINHWAVHAPFCSRRIKATLAWLLRLSSSEWLPRFLFVFSFLDCSAGQIVHAIHCLRSASSICRRAFIRLNRILAFACRNAVQWLLKSEIESLGGKACEDTRAALAAIGRHLAR